MPRSINLKEMHWKANAEYGRNEMGVGAKLLGGKDSYIGAFLDHDDGHKAAASKLGCFEWEMADEDAEDKSRHPSAALDRKANEIFEWAQDNLKGKWALYECFAYRFSCAYSHYFIEDAADREKFAARWGDVFKYTKPTSKNPDAVLTAFEKAQEQRTEASLKEAFAASSAELPLCKGLMENWTFVVARHAVGPEDRLYILPNEGLGDLIALFGGRVEKNTVRQLAGILEGKVNFKANDSFAYFVSQMYGGRGRDTFKAREVDGYCFALVMKDGGETQSCHGDLEKFRKAYREGRDVTFSFGGARFTFNVNNPLVAYSEHESHGTAMVDNHGGIVRGETADSVSGQYDRATGKPEGKWQRTVNSYSNSGGQGGGLREAAAVYRQGRLVKGSLQGAAYDEHYQPAPPQVKILGPKKKAAPK